MAYANRLPLGFGLSPFADVEPEGYLPVRGENMQVYYSAISPGFFDLMRIRPSAAGFEASRVR